MTLDPTISVVIARYEAGDVVCVKTDRIISPDTRAHIKADVAAAFTKAGHNDVAVVVLSRGMTMEIVRGDGDQ